MRKKHEATYLAMNVFYTEKMVASCESFSPSSSKPKLVVESWIRHGFDIDVVEPKPVTLRQLYRVHNKDYVDDVLACRIPNGFGNKSKAIADSLAYTSGAMLDAAHDAIFTGGFSCAPVAGFHHACWDYGNGFCTFNGLMVAALDLIDTGAAKKVGILDCDHHYGDGTDNIIRRLGDDGRIVHFSAGKKKVDAIFFLISLPDMIKDLYSDCDVLLYQAGADPHIDDPLGGWMTTSQLFERDIIVFKTAHKMNLPVAWDLAGGYQEDENGQITRYYVATAQSIPPRKSLI